MKKVIIYPGRFQPMLSHHAQVFDQLGALYNDADVYIATSDKVEPGKSPFNFEEKKKIIASHGIDPSKVLYARSPYNWEELSQYVSDVENTVIYFAVGEKDMESNPRFRFDNIDDKGINQKIKGGATYYQMINTYKDEPLPMNKRGYILKVPTISTEEEVASASAFRKAISTAPDKESAKLIFNKQFKQFDNDVFELVYNKLKGEKMSEDLNIMKKLAGITEKYANTEEKLQDMIDSHQYVINNNHPDDIKVFDHEDAIDWYEGLLDQHRKTREDTFHAPFGGDTAWREMIQQEMEEIGLYKPHAQGDMRGIDNLPEQEEKDLEEIKKLAGLEVSEGAPIEFEDQVSVKDIKFAEVSKSSSKLSIANRFPEGSDVNDMDAKKEMYVKELMKSPVALLSEINERIMPDENGLAVSTKLNKILDGMRDSGIADLDAEDKGFVMDLVKHSLKNMDLEAGDNREFDPETSSLESVELDDVRSDYGIEEGAGEYSYTLEYNGEEQGYSIHKLAITSPEGETKVVGDDFTYFDVEGDELQAELESWFKNGHGVGDDMDEGKVKDMAMDQADAFYDKVSSVADETNDIQKAIIDAWKDEEENPPVWALDNGAKDILADAGLIDEEPEEPEMEESIEEGNCPKCGEKRHKLKACANCGCSESFDPEMEESIEEGNCPKCGEKRHKLKACASCGCSESFDPDMEPSRKEDAMNLVSDQKWEEAAGVLGDTSKNAGSLLMAEWEEFCSLRGLDKKDTMEDFDTIENFIDEVIGTMDDKQYPAEMESIEEQEDAVVGKALDSAMIELKKLAGLY